MDYYGKLIRLINSDTVFDNVVIDASPEMISHYRLEHKTKDGSAFTQYKAAQALNFSDDKAISKIERGKAGMDNRTYSVFLLITNNHPHYSLEVISKASKLKDNNDVLVSSPDASVIKNYRKNIKGLSQKSMAHLLGLYPKMINKYESSSASIQNQRSPSSKTWTLLLLITKQHPRYKLVPKASQ